MQSSALMFQASIGFIFLIGITVLFSDNRKKINWRLILTAFILQNVTFLLISYVPFFASIINGMSSGLIKMLDFAQEGAKFVFGGFVDTSKFGFVFLLVVLPTIVFFGSLISILYFFGIIQRLISGLAWLLRRGIKLSGVESMVVIADIFLGQSEGPLVIGPYVKTMTRSELALAFTAGLSNLSGSTLGMYLVFLAGGNHQETLVFANFLVTATFMNAFSAIIFAKILFPETEFENVSTEKVELHAHFNTSFLDSLVQGAMTGVKVGIAIVTVLMAVIPLIHLLNAILGGFGDLIHINTLIASSTGNVFSGLSLEYILGQIFRIFAFFMGISWNETLQVGSLLGQKVAINEFVAYMSLGQMKAQQLLSSHSILVSTFALASFSNFSSIGISMGVFSILGPTKQKVLASIAFKALFGAVLAGFMTATVAGFWKLFLG